MCPKYILILFLQYCDQFRIKIRVLVGGMGTVLSGKSLEI